MREPHLRGISACLNERHAWARGELAGHWAMWVDGNWQLTFTFEGEDAVLVDCQDYPWRDDERERRWLVCTIHRTPVRCTRTRCCPLA
jgi:hypothetical protein